MLDAVDIFNAHTRSWSFAQLSERRCFLAATSLPSQGLAIFAGGFDGALKQQFSHFIPSLEEAMHFQTFGM